MSTETVKKFDKPTQVSRLELAFGGNMDALLPAWNSIPEEFKRSGNKWCRIVSKWFFVGMPNGTEYTPKKGIEPNEALAHVGAILRSWEPKHEHKEAGCAYLLSLWFDDIQFPQPQP